METKEPKPYVPDYVEWSKHQADFFRLTRNFEHEKRHLAVATEIKQLRDDLVFAMGLLNRMRAVDDYMTENAKTVTRAGGAAGYEIDQSLASAVLLSLHKAIAEPDGISEEAIALFNSRMRTEKEQNGNKTGTEEEQCAPI